MSGPRPNFIDVAKVIGVVLVAAGHCAWYSHSQYQRNVVWGVAHVVQLCHMPLFFYVSGMLHKSRNFRVGLEKVIKGLILPYLLLSIWGFLMFVVLGIGFGEISVKCCAKYLGAVFSGCDCSRFRMEILTGPLWFFFQ